MPELFILTGSVHHLALVCPINFIPTNSTNNPKPAILSIQARFSFGPASFINSD